MKTHWLVIVAFAGACGSDDHNPIGSRGGLDTLTHTSTAISLPLDALPGPSTSLPSPKMDAGIAPRCQFSVDSESACVGDLYGSPGVPVDLYILFDQSGSMATKDDGSIMRMDAVRSAVRKFLADPSSEGLGVGIGYFGSQPLTCACTSCDPNDYQTPSVGFATLPDIAPAILGSLDAIAPTGETPTGAALRGSCAYATAWKTKHPGREAAILLVTDGEPQAPLTAAKGTCSPTLQDAVTAATACQDAGHVRTYVLGVGPLLANLDKIAQAGGTKTAYLVENAGSDGVLAALNAIRKDIQIPCALTLPTGNIRLSTVNVVYADGECKLTTFARVDSASACPAQGGWYFDDPKNPATLQLCPASCDRVATPGGQLQLSIGCDTVLIP